MYFCHMTQRKIKKIIGIDPGTNIMGFAILNIENRELMVEDLGVLKMQHLKDHQSKLKEIFLQIQDIIETYQPEVMAIESPFFGKNVQSMLKLGRAQGVAIAAALTMGLDIQEYSPKKIKQSITGNGNASKEQVSAMLNHILKQKIKAKHLDATDALATAICHFNQSSGKKISGKRYNDWSSYISENKDRVG
jgi:crossover junction endodeoxyribonuclease RuvC